MQLVPDTSQILPRFLALCWLNKYILAPQNISSSQGYDVFTRFISCLQILLPFFFAALRIPVHSSRFSLMWWPSLSFLLFALISLCPPPPLSHPILTPLPIPYLQH